MKTLLTLFILTAAWCNAAMTLRDPFYAASLSSASVSWVQPISTIVTDASATPTTTNLTLTGGANAFRVWTGETSYTEPGFDLYVRTNAGNVVTVRLYRWTARIIYAPPGSSISLGTVDGRTLQATPIYVPAVLPAPSGATGNANCDKAGPPLWTPQNAHITLPTDGSSFVVKSNTSESILFISEYDGTTWSYPRFLWVQTNYDITVQATYKRVALANYDGTVQSIVAPAGSTIGGTSNLMTFTLPSSYGTTFEVTNGDQLLIAFTNVVAGDRIRLWGGPIYITNNIITNMFVANYAAGHPSLDGVTMVSGESTNVILTGSDTNFGTWTLHQIGCTSTTWVKNVTFDFNGKTNFKSFTATGGKWKFDNVYWYGPQVYANGYLLQLLNDANGPVNADAVWGGVYNSSGDCLSIAGRATHAATSNLRFVGMTVTNSGLAGSMQCLTTHSNIPLYAYGCFLADATNYVSANDSDLSPTYLNFCNINPGLRCGGFKHTAIYGCTMAHNGLAGGAASINALTNSYVLFNRIISTNYTSTINLFSAANQDTFEAFNHIFGVGGRSFEMNKNHRIVIGNIVDGFAESIRCNDYASGTKSNYVVMNNTVVNPATDFYSQETAGPITEFTNNALATATTRTVNVSYGGMTNVWHDYNVFANTAKGDVDWTNTFWVAGSPVTVSNDITNAAPQLTGWLFPTASGNCDGNGAVMLSCGESDAYGFVLVYLPTRMSRGAREIPAIYAGAVLYPDIW